MTKNGCLALVFTIVACQPPDDAETGDARDPVAVASVGGDAISDTQFVYHSYQVLLNRAPDAPGFDLWLHGVRGTAGRVGIFNALLSVPEFLNSATNPNKTEYVKRLYHVILERGGATEPTAAQVAGWVNALKNPDGSGTQPFTWYDAFVAFVDSPEYGMRRRPIAGVHFAIPIEPQVSLTDADVVAHAYRAILGRPYTSDSTTAGFTANVNYVRSHDRAALWAVFARNAEYLQNTAGMTLDQRKRRYVQNAFQAVLGRLPPADYVTSTVAVLRDEVAAGSGMTWYDYYLTLVAAPEFAGACPRSYYTYDVALPRAAPLLRDLMNRSARIRTIPESDPVSLRFSPGGTVTRQWDQKLAMVRDPATGLLYAYTRGWNDPTQKFNIYLMHNSAAAPLTFDQLGDGIFDQSKNFYDPQIAIDNSVCPRRFIMTMECDGSLCMSYSTTPLRPETWTPPARVVAATQTPYRSASTGVTLIDHDRSYVAWSEINDRNVYFLDSQHRQIPDEGNEYTLTSGMAVANPYSILAGDVAHLNAATLLPAEPNTHCSSAWDCNNRNTTDWRQEGPYYYSLYSGANYYRCGRPPGDTGSNLWGVGVARSRQPLGSYSERITEDQAIFPIGDAQGCVLSYPSAFVMQNGLYVFYADRTGTGVHRSGLMWVTGTPPP
jgi:hypothetical protein